MVPLDHPVHPPRQRGTLAGRHIRQIQPGIAESCAGKLPDKLSARNEVTLGRDRTHPADSHIDPRLRLIDMVVNAVPDQNMIVAFVDVEYVLLNVKETLKLDFKTGT